MQSLSKILEELNDEDVECLAGDLMERHYTYKESGRFNLARVYSQMAAEILNKIIGKR